MTWKNYICFRKCFILVASLGDNLLKKVEQERTSNGDSYDSNFTTSIKQRKENVETLFYRLLHQVVMHDRERGLNSGMEVAEDFSVSKCLGFNILKLIFRRYSTSRISLGRCGFVLWNWFYSAMVVSVSFLGAPKLHAQHL